jgi:hypothetical protein
MAPDRKAFNRLRQLSEVQDLRVHAAAVDLGSAQKNSRSMRSVWQDAASREAAVKGELALMLKSGGFVCGTYTTTLDLLNAHSTETHARLKLLHDAETSEALSSAAYRHAEAQAGLVKENLASMGKRLRNRAADQRELKARDLHNMRRREDAR